MVDPIDGKKRRSGMSDTVHKDDRYMPQGGGKHATTANFAFRSSSPHRGSCPGICHHGGGPERQWHSAIAEGHHSHGERGRKAGGGQAVDPSSTAIL
jgi:hypothetical protein